jgi:hypothetical protein
MDSGSWIFWRGNGGSLVFALDRSSRVFRARILGLCASSKVKARAHTVMVSATLRRLRLGGGGDFGGHLEPSGRRNPIKWTRPPEARPGGPKLVPLTAGTFAAG